MIICVFGNHLMSAGMQTTFYCGTFMPPRGFISVFLSVFLSSLFCVALKRKYQLRGQNGVFNYLMDKYPMNFMDHI